MGVCEGISSWGRKWRGKKLDENGEGEEGGYEEGGGRGEGLSNYFVFGG